LEFLNWQIAGYTEPPPARYYRKEFWSKKEKGRWLGIVRISGLNESSSLVLFPFVWLLKKSNRPPRIHLSPSFICVLANHSFGVFDLRYPSFDKGSPAQGPRNSWYHDKQTLE
jgi:hypothetical protein